MVALRNKAIACVMVIFGGHPKDMWRMHEAKVEIRADHIDREGHRRPKIIFRGVKCKEPHVPTVNVLDCGCSGHHNIGNEHCLYNVVSLYEYVMQKS